MIHFKYGFQKILVYEFLWYKVLYPLLVLGGMGFGVLNEVVEFVAVAFFGQTGVGDYWNTALDLVFNMFGAIIATVFIHYYYQPKNNLAQNVTL